MIRFLTAGESHGPGLVTIVEGVPMGLPFVAAGLSDELARRRLGYGRGPRMRIESDELEILGGVRFERTLGSPVAVLIRNTEWERWSDEMAPGPGEADRPMTTPRPGHADLAGMVKYGTYDARDILERASARETAARTVAGYAAKQLLAQIGVTVLSHVVRIGPVETGKHLIPTAADIETIDASPVRVFDDQEAESSMVVAIESAKSDRDTLGGIVEVVAHGVPIGVGSHVHYDRRLDTRLAGALMSIPGIKAVEVGDGFASAARLGSEAHDEILVNGGEMHRDTNRAGGIEGGISNGSVIRVRAAQKPLSTLMRPLRSVDVTTKEAVDAFRERSDVVSVPAAGVVAEQMVAVVLAAELQRLYGGDSVAALADAHQSHLARIASY
jgi:chorismate synthase